jgi:hypothetical protein
MLPAGEGGPAGVVVWAKSRAVLVATPSAHRRLADSISDLAPA